MIHVPTTIETDFLGGLIKLVFSLGLDWLKGRKKKPSPNEVKQKVEELAAEATTTALPDLSVKDQRLLAGQIAELTLPSFEQVVQYSPNTQRVITAARKVPAKKKGPPRKRVTKKAAAKIVVRKRLVRVASKRR
jgi:hypothetical protein